MTVSRIIADPRKHNRTPEFVFYARSGDRVNVHRAHDRDRLGLRHARHRHARRSDLGGRYAPGQETAG